MEKLNSILIYDREYLVSKDGNVYKSDGTMLHKHKRNGGYEYVAIQVNKIRKKYSVHRLVCKAFHDNPNNYPMVNHIDGNPTNNHADNLEWISGSGNQYHSRYSLGNQTGFKDTPIRCVETGKTYISTRDAWRDTGICYSHISECANGKRKSAGGFTWKPLEGVV